MMTAKKKTVSEWNKIVECFVEKVKYLEGKIKHLKDNINRPKSYPDIESELFRSKMSQESIKCRKCDSIFKTRKLLRD